MFSVLFSSLLGSSGGYQAKASWRRSRNFPVTQQVGLSTVQDLAGCCRWTSGSWKRRVELAVVVLGVGEVNVDKHWLPCGVRGLQQRHWRPTSGCCRGEAGSRSGSRCDDRACGVSGVMMSIQRVGKFSSVLSCRGRSNCWRLFLLLSVARLVARATTGAYRPAASVRKASSRLTCGLYS